MDVGVQLVFCTKWLCRCQDVTHCNRREGLQPHMLTEYKAVRFCINANDRSRYYFEEENLRLFFIVGGGGGGIFCDPFDCS